MLIMHRLGMKMLSKAGVDDGGGDDGDDGDDGDVAGSSSIMSSAA